MKKNGFTVVELIVSFSLVTAIAIILFQLIFSLKELYVSGDVKTTLLNKQGIMTKKINEDLENKTLLAINSCGVSCLTFEYTEGNVELLVDVAANTVTYDNYTMKLSEGSGFGNLSFTYQENGSSLDKSDSLFNLNIPIISKFFDDDFGIHIIKLYRNSEMSINKTIPLSSATIVANKVPLRLNTTTEEDNSTATWANILHQDKGSNFSTFEEFLKSTNGSKKSSLKSLEVFRSINKTDSLKNQENYNSLNDKEKKRMDENYQNGYLEFLLDYSNNLSLGNYNQWAQTSNFTTQKNLTNAVNIDTIYNNSSCKWLNGIKYNENKQKLAYANGCYGDYFAIGVTGSNKLLGSDKEVNTVDLWIRADEYIKKHALSTIIY